MFWNLAENIQKWSLLLSGVNFFYDVGLLFDLVDGLLVLEVLHDFVKLCLHVLDGTAVVVFFVFVVVLILLLQLTFLLFVVLILFILFFILCFLFFVLQVHLATVYHFFSLALTNFFYIYTFIVFLAEGHVFMHFCLKLSPASSPDRVCFSFFVFFFFLFFIVKLSFTWIELATRRGAVKLILKLGLRCLDVIRRVNKFIIVFVALLFLVDPTRNVVFLRRPRKLILRVEMTSATITELLLDELVCVLFLHLLLVKHLLLLLLV